MTREELNKSIRVLTNILGYYLDDIDVEEVIETYEEMMNHDIHRN
jgi:pentatricopeptide repeat protein